MTKTKEWVVQKNKTESQISIKMNTAGNTSNLVMSFPFVNQLNLWVVNNACKYLILNLHFEVVAEGGSTACFL